MLGGIRRFFEERCCFSERETPPEKADQALHLAAAALMLEMVRADHSADDKEYDAVVDTLQRLWNIPEQDLGRLVALAARQTHQATDLFEFTSAVNDHYTPQQKKSLIESLWEIAFADGQLHHFEEHLVRKIAELIYVPHSEFIQTKLAVQERLGLAT